MQTQTVHQQIQEFDRCLNRTYLATLSLNESRLLLTKVGLFIAEAKIQIEELAQHDDYSQKMLWLTGYRLCVDLSEKIQGRVMDLLQQREQEIQVLNSKLRQQLQDQFLASQLLKTVQGLKQQQVAVADLAGIGPAI